MQRFGYMVHSINKQVVRLDLKELIRQCILGSPADQKRLFEMFLTPMSRLCQRYLKNSDDVSDVLMQGYSKVFECLRDFRYQGENSLEVWIRKIMINECLMKLRQDRSRFFMDINDECLDRDDVTENNVSADEILAIIGGLPAGYRMVFNLFAIDGYSHKEISVLLGISESASRSQLSHARSKLQELLQKHGWK